MIDREIYYRDVNLFKKPMAIDKVKKNKQKSICFIIFLEKKKLININKIFNNKGDLMSYRRCLEYRVVI